MTQNSDKYRRAMDGLTAVVDTVPADKWSTESPSAAGWTAAHVVGHVIGGMQMISGVRTGDTPKFDDPLAAAGDDPAASFAAARDGALDTLTDEFLAKIVPSPMGEMPLDQFVGLILTNDVLIHTWDLPRATGVDVQLDPELAEGAYDALQPMDAMVRSDQVFGPKVEPPPDADAQTKLLCFTGRTP